MILLCQCTDSEARDMAEKIRRGIESRAFPITRRVTASIGVTRAERGESADPLIGRVDRALYQAKTEGKNCIRSL